MNAGPFHADLLRNPGPGAKPRRRERFIPIGYTLIFAVFFGFGFYAGLIWFLWRLSI